MATAPNPAVDRKFWDEKLETQSRADWAALKLELLQQHLLYAYDHSPYYKASFDAAGVHPDQIKSLDDSRRFPFIDKKVLRDRQTAVPPFGDLVAAPEPDIVYISDGLHWAEDHILDDMLIVDRENHLDRLTVEIERAAIDGGNDVALAQRFAGHLKSITGVWS